MTTEKHGGGSVPDASGYTMDPAEVLRRAGAFDPTPKHAAVMRLALEMILAQCKCYTEGRAYIVDPIRRTAEQALRECGK